MFISTLFHIFHKYGWEIILKSWTRIILRSEMSKEAKYKSASFCIIDGLIKLPYLTISFYTVSLL